MAQKHSVQIDRDDERFTQHAITYRLVAQLNGVAVPTYASPHEVVHATLLACPQGRDITFPAVPKLNGAWEGNKGHRYNGPSKRTLKRRGSRALRSA